MEMSSWDKVLGPITDYVKNSLFKIEDNNYLEFCVDNTEIRQIIERYLENHAIRSRSKWKNNEISNAKRLEGNRKYKEKNCEESLYLYTQSIWYAECNSECLPLAYANRSLVLQKMGFILESLEDVNLAISTGYPENKLGTLILRKAKCLIHLGYLDEAKKVLEESLQELYVKGFVSLINNELEQLKNMEINGTSQSQPRTNSDLPQLVGGSNNNFTSASKFLSVMYNKEKGRHVIATNDIDIGEVLFVERPFGCVYFEKFCPECGKQPVAPIPCDNCLEVFYCSLKCKNKFWKSVHKLECGFHELFKSIGIAHLSLRIVLNASSTFRELKKSIQSIKQIEPSDGIVTYDSGNYDSVYNLITNIEKYEVSDMIQYILTALLLAIYLKKYTSYFSESSEMEDDLRTLVFVLWRHIMQLICNGHAISNVFKNCTKGATFEETEGRVGTAIYPSASMMNHACEPSIINSFCGKYLIVRAAKPIKAGEEVFNCYGPHAKRMNRAKRQEILNSQYFFQCKCQACIEEYDILERYTAFKCSTCKGPLVAGKENSMCVICLDCRQNLNVTNELLEKKNLIYSLLQEGESLLEWDVTLALKKFLKCWRLGREIFYKFHKDLSFAADQSARCLAMLGDYKKCIAFLKCCVLSVEERYGSFSMELAKELQKLGDSITEYCPEADKGTARILAQEGLGRYEKAEKIIRVLMGVENEGLREIEKNKQRLLIFSTS